jgi:hypothetical protein
MPEPRTSRQRRQESAWSRCRTREPTKRRCDLRAPAGVDLDAAGAELDAILGLLVSAHAGIW